MYNRQSVLENETQTPRRFWDTNGSPNLDQTTRPSTTQQEKKNLPNNRFYFLVDHRVKLKEREKKDKYRDLARELKKLWHMKVTLIPIVIGALGTVTKGLVQGLEDLEMKGPMKTIQTIALLRSARIQRRVLEIWGDLQ